MTANFRMIATNYFDDATISASPALVATLPETNLQNDSIARVARSTSTADQQILGDLSQNRTVSALALVRHNLSIAATWRLELFSGAGQTGTTVYDSTALAATAAPTLGELMWGIDPIGATVFYDWDYAYSILFFTPTLAMSFRLTISDSGNMDGYVEASRMFLSNHFEASVNFDWNARLTWKDESRQTRTAGGSLRTDAQSAKRQLQVDFRWLSESEKTQLLSVGRLVGKRKDVMISAYPDQMMSREIEFSFHGKFTNSPEFSPPFSHNYWTTSFLFEEI